jgi:hypothetical protein
MIEQLTTNVGKLEQRVEHSINGLQTRFVILEGKLRFVEEQLAQQHQDHQSMNSRIIAQQSQFVHTFTHQPQTCKDSPMGVIHTEPLFPSQR